jgi:hypothetical protein
VHVVRQSRADIVYAREPFDHSGLGMLPLLEEPRDVALRASDPLAAKALLRLADLADRRLLQDPAAVPEWYEIATPDQRRACICAAAHTVEEKLEIVAAAKGFVILPRSTTAFYRRPDVSITPIADIAPSRVVLIWDAAASVVHATISSRSRWPARHRRSEAHRPRAGSRIVARQHLINLTDLISLQARRPLSSRCVGVVGRGTRASWRRCRTPSRCARPRCCSWNGRRRWSGNQCCGTV